MCQKRVAKHFEQSRLALPAGATKGVDGRSDLDIDKTALLKHMPPACARQATGNSIGPKVDVAQRARGDLLAVRNVGELQAPARFQHAHDFGEDLPLVGAEVDDAVADNDIGPAVLDRQLLNDAPAELDIAEPRSCRTKQEDLLK